MSKSRRFKIPGVYVEEISAFPRSIAQVKTAVPAFIGYTEKAKDNGTSLINRPTKITSILEFEQLFGRGIKTQYNLSVDAANSSKYEIFNTVDSRFLLYASIKLYFQNGGGKCYIVSVGTFGAETVIPDFGIAPFLNGLTVLEPQPEVTLVLSPDATQLGQTDCYHFYSQLLTHCGALENRFAILDIHAGFEGLNLTNPNCVDRFRQHVNGSFMRFGAVYYPWLHTNMVTFSDVDFTNFSRSCRTALRLICETYARKKLKLSQRDDLEPYLEVLSKKGKARLSKGNLPSQATTHHVLSQIIPSYSKILSKVLERENLLPSSAAIAGIYYRVDEQRGVWKAPANVVVTGVIKPAVDIDNAQQDGLNVHVAGTSICAIRSFVGKGVFIWGARTLDGNNGEFKYVNVSRTVITIRTSVKNGMLPYVFEPNVPTTWANVKALISNYFNALWRQGALAGTKPSEAYFVKVGLGETMTANDIQNGHLIVEIGMALTRPAEFIVEHISIEMSPS